MNKKERRDAAVKRAKRKKTIIITACAAVVVVVAALAIVFSYLQGRNRVYTDGHQKVTLKHDGTFTAELAHETREGTYAESETGGIITVTFIVGGSSVEGLIADDVMTIPGEWQDDHGHGSLLWLK